MQMHLRHQDEGGKRRQHVRCAGRALRPAVGALRVVAGERAAAGGGCRREARARVSPKFTRQCGLARGSQRLRPAHSVHHNLARNWLAHHRQHQEWYARGLSGTLFARTSQRSSV